MTRLAPLAAAALAALALAAHSAGFQERLLEQAAGAASNTAVSPASVGQALLMLRAGTSGKASDQIDALLGKEPAGVAGLAAHGSELAFADALWIAEGFPVNPAYEKAVWTRFGTGAARLPFAVQPKAAVRSINSWISEKTDGKIGQLLPESAVTASTSLVLTDALRMKVAWAEPFEEKATASEPFEGAAAVPMMARTGFMPYGLAPCGERIALATRDLGYWLVAELPRPGADPRSCFEDFSQASLKAFLASPGQMVELHLPRFRAGFRAEISPVLRAMGLKAVFEDRDAFGGISSQPLSLSAVWHGAEFSVDEKGCEGAAATAMAMVGMSRSPYQPVQVRFDRPFAWALVHARDGRALFGGVVRAPAAGPAALH